ncbi:hypothetical protein D6779_00230, partial [Candidatus Parcubacteria bacterium]
MPKRMLATAVFLFTVATGIGVLVAATPPERDAIRIDATDRDILEQRLFIGRSDLIDPEHFLPWTLSFVAPPASFDDNPIVVAYFCRWKALARAFQYVTKKYPEVFRRVNRQLVRDLGPLPTLYELREAAFATLTSEGLIREIVRRADLFCPRAQEIPSVYRAAPLAVWG